MENAIPLGSSKAPLLERSVILKSLLHTLSAFIIYYMISIRCLLVDPWGSGYDAVLFIRLKYYHRMNGTGLRRHSAKSWSDS